MPLRNFRLANLLPFLICFQTCVYANDKLDLEKKPQDFVLETIKISVPDYPHAFNPSIIRWQGRLLMSFREIPSDYSYPSALNCAGPSHIGLVWLDDNFNPVSQAQILDTNPHQNKSMSICSEDARLVSIGDLLYIVYSDNCDEILSDEGFHMLFGELNFNGETFSIKDIQHLTKFEGSQRNRREKNWVPFDYCGNLLLAYSLLPHRILFPLIGTNYCETLTSTSGMIDWRWGELRGGTPALAIDDKQYLSFFHSSIDLASKHSEGKSVPHYFMGAYTFTLESPFTITQISAEPIIGKNFYEGISYEPYWKPVVAIFPCGYIFDENFIWISFGRQDHEIWVVKLDRQDLLESLVPVK